MREANGNGCTAADNVRNISPQIALVCRAGHPLSASVNLSLDILNPGILDVAQPEGDNIEIYCAADSNCLAGVDPDVARRSRALVTSFPAYLPQQITVPTCRSCGCTEYAPCEGGCAWTQPLGIGPNLCSACADVQVAVDNVSRKPCSVCQSDPHDRACPRVDILVAPLTRL